jgi:hypothetical protein
MARAPAARPGLGTTAVAALLVLAGCSFGAAPTTPDRGTLTPAPVPATPTPATASSTPVTPATPYPRASPVSFDQSTTYPVGPVVPSCPTGPGSDERRYPPVVTNRVTVDGGWSSDREAVALAERARVRTPLGAPDADLVAVADSYRRVRLAGETFDPRRRFDTSRFALVTAARDPALVGIVPAPDGNRTTVQFYYVAGFC